MINQSKIPTFWQILEILHLIGNQSEQKESSVNKGHANYT